MKEQIVSKLDEIADVLKYRAINYNMVDTGLYGYAMGTILFFCYYRKFKCCHEYDNLLEILLDKVFEKIGNGIYFPTYCTGIAGTLYGMQYIQEKKLIVIDVTEAQDCYSDYIRTRMLAEMNRGNIDFLHGATGIGIYLLKYALSKGSENTIVTYIDYLEKSGIYLDNTIKWVSNDISEANHIVNISLSHGMSSIAIFLARVFKTEIIPQRVENILNLATNYILDQEIDKEKYGCYFPFKSIESEGKNITRSRLGWCYGDLGVATALWYVGKVLVNNMLQNKAIEVLKHASTHLDLNGNNVLDACLCHGTAGIA